MKRAPHRLNQLLENLPDEQIAFDNLTDRERILIRRTREGRLLREIGQEFGVTVERVRQLKFRTYRILKACMNGKSRPDKLLPGFIDSKTACQILGITQPTINRMAHRGELQAIRRWGGQWMFSLDAVKRLAHLRSEIKNLITDSSAP